MIGPSTLKSTPVTPNITGLSVKYQEVKSYGYA